MLEPTLSVRLIETGYEFVLTIENVGEAAEELSFSSGQRAEFTAQQDGNIVWQWSEGRMFTMALSTDRIDPGERRSYTGTWEDPTPGEYVITGRLEATTHDVETTIELTIDE